MGTVILAVVFVLFVIAIAVSIVMSSGDKHATEFDEIHRQHKYQVDLASSVHKDEIAKLKSAHRLEVIQEHRKAFAEGREHGLQLSMDAVHGLRGMPEVKE